MKHCVIFLMSEMLEEPGNLLGADHLVLASYSSAEDAQALADSINAHFSGHSSPIMDGTSQKPYAKVVSVAGVPQAGSRLLEGAPVYSVIP